MPRGRRCREGALRAHDRVEVQRPRGDRNQPETLRCSAPAGGGPGCPYGLRSTADLHRRCERRPLGPASRNVLAGRGRQRSQLGGMLLGGARSDYQRMRRQRGGRRRERHLGHGQPPSGERSTAQGRSGHDRTRCHTDVRYRNRRARWCERDIDTADVDRAGLSQIGQPARSHVARIGDVFVEVAHDQAVSPVHATCRCGEQSLNPVPHPSSTTCRTSSCPDHPWPGHRRLSRPELPAREATRSRDGRKRKRWTEFPQIAGSNALRNG